MHSLEYILLLTSVAAAKDEISKAELVRILETLAGLAHGYQPAPFEIPESGIRDADEALVPMKDDLHERFIHLIATEV